MGQIDKSSYLKFAHVQNYVDFYNGRTTLLSYYKLRSQLVSIERGLNT